MSVNSSYSVVVVHRVLGSDGLLGSAATRNASTHITRFGIWKWMYGKVVALIHASHHTIVLNACILGVTRGRGRVNAGGIEICIMHQWTHTYTVNLQGDILCQSKVKGLCLSRSAILVKEIWSFFGWMMWYAFPSCTCIKYRNFTCQIETNADLPENIETWMQSNTTSSGKILCLLLWFELYVPLFFSYQNGHKVSFNCNLLRMLSVFCSVPQDMIPLNPNQYHFPSPYFTHSVRSGVQGNWNEWSRHQIDYTGKWIDLSPINSCEVTQCTSLFYTCKSSTGTMLASQACTYVWYWYSLSNIEYCWWIIWMVLLVSRCIAPARPIAVCCMAQLPEKDDLRSENKHNGLVDNSQDAAAQANKQVLLHICIVPGIASCFPTASVPHGHSHHFVFCFIKCRCNWFTLAAITEKLNCRFHNSLLHDLCATLFACNKCCKNLFGWWRHRDYYLGRCLLRELLRAQAACAVWLLDAHLV